MQAKMASAMRTVVRALAKALTCNAITIKPPEFLRSAGVLKITSLVCVNPFGNALDRRLLDAEITVRRLRFARLVIDLCQIGSLELAYLYSSCPTAATQAERENHLTTRATSEQAWPGLDTK